MGWWLVTLDHLTVWNLVVVAAGLTSFGLAALCVASRPRLRSLAIGGVVVLLMVALMALVDDIDWSPLGPSNEEEIVHIWRLLHHVLRAASNVQLALPVALINLGLLLVSWLGDRRRGHQALTPSLIAVRRDRLDAVKALLEAKVDVEVGSRARIIKLLERHKIR